MMRTASIRLELSAAQADALGRLRTAYADACNRLVLIVREHRLWNRLGLHQRTYTMLREVRPLGSQSARQKLRQVSGKEARRVKHINHETSKAIVQAATQTGVAKITMEDLTHIRERIKTGKRMRGRLHRWARRQLQTFVEYKAKAAGIAVEYVNPAYTSQTCACCGELGKRSKHRFECPHCGLRAHSDLNASRNLARIGETAVSPRAAVNTPDVGSVDMGNHVCASQLTMSALHNKACDFSRGLFTSEQFI